MEGQKEIKRVISIDFGSTNSQVGVRFFDKASGKPLDNKNNLEAYLISDSDSSTNIPTVLAEWKGESNKKFAGNVLYKEIDNYSFDDCEIITEFKRDLFYSKEDMEKDESKRVKYEAAEKYTEEFLRYLHDEILINGNRGNDYIADETRVILTVPARSTAENKKTMIKLAKNAGWGDISLTEDVQNEEKSALNYAVYCPDSPLQRGLEQSTATSKGYSHILMIDIGGSTTDIVHAKIRPSENGGYEYETYARWPEKTGESNTLGQIDIDKAVYDFMIKKGFILPHLAEQNIKFIGYKKFRDFKENWSNQAKVDNKVLRLGSLQEFAYDPDESEMAPVLYKNLPVGREEFKQLTKDYIEKLQDAVRIVLKHDNIKETDIDYVILSGGGSKMYGIREMITGDLNTVSNPLKFTKIMNDKSRCIESKGENPSAMCCMGNLIETKKIKCKTHINGAYYVEIDIFKGPAGDLNSGNFKVENGIKPTLPHSAVLKKENKFKFTINNDMDALPLSKEKSIDFKMNLKTGDKIACRIAVFKKDPNGISSHIQQSWIFATDRSINKWFIDIIKQMLGQSVTEAVPGKLKINYSISENETMTIKPIFEIKGFDNGLNNTEIKLGGE